MDRRPRWLDYVTINSYWFALTARSQALSPLIIPLLVQQFVGEGAKGAFVGILRLWALMAAVLVQSLIGMLSDRSRSPWGRRRPFIVVGAVGELIILAALGFVPGLAGTTGYRVLFSLYILSMVASNTAHAATQALIPDLVPDARKGLYSGVKALFELPLPMIFVSLVVGRLVARGNVWGGLAALGGAIVACTVLTLWVPEKPYREPLPALDWRPFLRLAAMTAAFTAAILGTGAAVRGLVTLATHQGANTGRLAVAVVGVAGMLVASVLGVWLCIRIGLGDMARGHRSFTWWVVNRLICLVASTNLGQFMIFFLQERFPEFQGLSAAGPATVVLMVVGLFMLLVALPSGLLADRVSKRLLMLIAGLVASTGALIVVSLPQMMAVYAGSALVGVGMGVFYAANWALGTAIVPKDRAGQFLGLSNLAGAGAGAIGAYIGGPLADRMSYSLLMGIYGLLFLLSTLPLLGIQEDRPKRAP
jgi:MFS family permease